MHIPVSSSERSPHVAVDTFAQLSFRQGSCDRRSKIRLYSPCDPEVPGHSAVCLSFPQYKHADTGKYDEAARRVQFHWVLQPQPNKNGQFQVGKQIGQGAYATVAFGLHKETSKKARR